MDSYEELVVDRVLLEVRFCDKLRRLLPLVHQPNVNAVHHVLASFSKNRVVRKLPKVLFEGVSRDLPLLHVFLNVGLHPRGFVERESFVNLGDPATEFLVPLDVPNVSNVLGFRKEVRRKFFDSTEFDPIGGRRVILELVVKLLRKLEVHGNEARWKLVKRFFEFGGLEPSKSTDGQRLEHRPAVERIRIGVEDVGGRLARVVPISHVLVVRFCLALHDRGDSASFPSFDEIEHLGVAHEFEPDVGRFQKRVVKHPRCGDVVAGVHLEVFECHASKVFENVGEKEYVGLEVQIVVLAHRFHPEGFPNVLGVGLLRIRDPGRA